MTCSSIFSASRRKEGPGRLRYPEFCCDARASCLERVSKKSRARKNGASRERSNVVSRMQTIAGRMPALPVFIGLIRPSLTNTRLRGGAW